MDNHRNYFHIFLPKILLVFFALPALCFGSNPFDDFLIDKSRNICASIKGHRDNELASIFDQLQYHMAVSEDPIKASKDLVDNLIKEWNKNNEKKLSKQSALKYIKSNFHHINFPSPYSELIMKFVQEMFRDNENPFNPVFYTALPIPILLYKNFGSDLSGNDMVGLVEIAIGVLFMTGAVEFPGLGTVGVLMLGDGSRRLGDRFASDIDDSQRRRREAEEANGLNR